MKKICSIVFSLLMAISIFNLFSAMALPISDGTSAAGIVPAFHTGNINPATVTGELQFKWDSPDISGHTSYVDIVIPGTEDHVSGAIHYQSSDGKRLTWWLTDLSSDDPDHQLIVSWIAVKGGDNYNTYSYPSSLTTPYPWKEYLLPATASSSLPQTMETTHLISATWFFA